jgi:hypothetical protein
MLRSVSAFHDTPLGEMWWPVSSNACVPCVDTRSSVYCSSIDGVSLSHRQRSVPSLIDLFMIITIQCLHFLGRVWLSEWFMFTLSFNIGLCFHLFFPWVRRMSYVCFGGQVMSPVRHNIPLTSLKVPGTCRAEYWDHCSIVKAATWYWRQCLLWECEQASRILPQSSCYTSKYPFWHLYLEPIWLCFQCFAHLRSFHQLLKTSFSVEIPKDNCIWRKEVD